jgi:dipeptide/tripeptide permease
MKSILRKRDGAYSLYYMGVNAGAFLGIMLCGYIGEKFPGLGLDYGNLYVFECYSILLKIFLVLLV